MSSEISLIVNESDDQNNYIQVPIKKKDFGDFITNLLGQPEKASRRFQGNFKLNLEWFVHIHHLIDQRIKQQNHSTLVDFSAIIRYENGQDRTITTLDGFLAFNEAMLVSTKDIKITWTYLVQFPTKVAPEKQEITLIAMTEKKKVTLSKGTINLTEAEGGDGMVIYRISHTQRTWCDDIQSLLSREIEGKVKEKDQQNSYLQTTTLFLAFAIFLAGIFVPDYLEQIIREKEIASIYASFLSNEATVESLSISEKLDLTLKLIDPGKDLFTMDTWFRFLSLIVSLLLATFTVSVFDPKDKSFLIITSKDVDEATKHKKKESRHLIIKLASFLCAIATGVIGNYVYYYLNLS